jgi:hypothetical protein
MSRCYTPEEKHKHPKGFGSLCPAGVSGQEAATLLAAAVCVPGVSANKLWAASGLWLFCAHRSTGRGDDAWHGWPVIGGEADERVLAELEHQGLIDSRQRRRLRKQRQLPKA